MWLGRGDSRLVPETMVEMVGRFADGIVGEAESSVSRG